MNVFTEINDKSVVLYESNPENPPPEFEGVPREIDPEFAIPGHLRQESFSYGMNRVLQREGRSNYIKYMRKFKKKAK